jgi:hypothetical protein
MNVARVAVVSLVGLIVVILLMRQILEQMNR